MDQAKRDAMLATWRNSMRASAQPRIADESHWRVMVSEHRQAQVAQQQQQMVANYRDNKLDAMMRRANGLDLHKAAMRKMQAGASRNVSIVLLRVGHLFVPCTCAFCERQSSLLLLLAGFWRYTLSLWRHPGMLGWLVRPSPLLNA